MHINVRDILAGSVGETREFKVTGERPQLEHNRLISDLEGGFSISRMESGLRIMARLQTDVELECHRCLSLFAHPVRISFAQVFSDEPGDDELPIQRDGSIELAPAIDQEITLSLPIKLLCHPDCNGIAPPDFKTLKETKGYLRGRTQKTH